MDDRPCMIKAYQNTEKGVEQFLNEAIRFNTVGAKYEIEPGPEGVWKVTSKGRGRVVIVYLRGYRDSFGNKRVFNDTEEIW